MAQSHCREPETGTEKLWLRQYWHFKLKSILSADWNIIQYSTAWPSITMSCQLLRQRSRQKLFNSKDITKANKRSYWQKSFTFLHSERIILFHYFRFFVLPLLLFIDFTNNMSPPLKRTNWFYSTRFLYEQPSDMLPILTAWSIQCQFFSDEPDWKWLTP